MSKHTMKSTDGRELPLLDESSHSRQEAGPQPQWQDSVVLIWSDLEQGVGGVHRIGHEVNAGAGAGGMVALWNSVFSPQGIYKQTRYQPLREEDLPASGGFGGGDDSCRCEYMDGEHIWTIEDTEVSARLVHRDTGPNVDCYPKRGALSDFTAGHLDIPGRVSGWLRVKGKEYRVDGLSVRDHGWGPRDWSSALSHRWISGTAGPELGFIALSWHASDDSLTTFGWVVRNGEITYAKELDILTYTEVDGATNRGGRVRFELPDGETLDIECTPLARGAASYHHGVCCIDVMCRFSCNGSLTGICDFESSSNLQHGAREPGNLVAVIENGFFPG